MNISSANSSRTAIPSFGTWLSVGSPVVAELAAESGFDWLLFDLEHGCGTESGLLGNLQAIKGTSAEGIVRLGAPYPDLVMRTLDWGADGIMVPHISTAAEAEACVQAMNHPPRGRRGVSRTVRAHSYGLRGRKRAQPVLMVQIETLNAIDRVDEIAGVVGVDVLFVGPGDLSYDIKVRNGTTEHSYEGCLQKVAQSASKAGKRAGILVRDYDEIPRVMTLGYTEIAVDSDLAILRAGYEAIVSRTGALRRDPTRV